MAKQDFFSEGKSSSSLLEEPKCEKCNGTGKIGFFNKKCPECGGTGKKFNL